MDIAYSRTGAGTPLVLLHALGTGRASWDPVVPALARSFDVIAVDLPGFGRSAPLPAEPTPAAIAAALATFFDGLGIARPHVAGNSLGGWVALELAGIRPVASLTLLSPAGLWRRTPLYCRVSLRITRWLARHAARPLSRLVQGWLGRALVLGQTHGRPGNATPDYARAAIRAMGTCPGFDATLRATSKRGYVAGRAFAAPVTVAFGSRDLLLPRRRARRLDQLPPGTRVTSLPGCGHIPMTDDPRAVTVLITSSAARVPLVAP